MKIKIILTSLLFSMILTGCVQPSYNRTVLVTLDVAALKDIETVGIRGEGKPLSWENDYPMTEVVKDSLYRAIMTTKTGYLFAEYKCTVNGNFELQNQPNRRVNFDTKKDTTYVNLVFDKP
jgi:PBP1b-binding outer membrane lipoprotein LpoB